MNKLLILSQDADQYSSLIEAVGLPQLEILSTDRVEVAKQVVTDCNILLAEPLLASHILDSARRLQWIQSSWAGIDKLCQPGLRKDYTLTGVKGIFGPLISEYVFTYLFALERHVFDMRLNQLEKRWQPIPYRLAGDITVGIIGLGSIGQHVAQTAARFGIRVTGLNRSGKACPDVETVYTEDKLAEFLAEPDYLVITLPETPLTKHFVNAKVLQMMKNSAVLINVGRGSAVKESDLVTALRQGEIGAAVLDVFESEPLAAESPLWSMPDVFITPHSAASSFAGDVVKVFSENYQRFLHNQSLLYTVDFDRGY